MLFTDHEADVRGRAVDRAFYVENGVDLFDRFERDG
jgi:hypothetical protein